MSKLINILTLKKMKREHYFSIIILTLSIIGIFLSLFNNFNETKNPFNLKNKDFISINKAKILSLSLDGPMYEGESSSMLGMTSMSSASRLKAELAKALKNDNIKGIIIRINSPGGTVGISQEIYSLITQLKKKNKLIIATMGDVAASGGYYVASACDLIFANKSALTGSIGVILNTLNYESLAQKLGVKSVTIKAGKYKDSGNPFRQMSAEEKAIFQDLIDETYDEFIHDVYLGRHSLKYGDFRKDLTEEDIRLIAEGRIYTGKKAYEYGLVDKLGGYDDALSLLQSMLKKKYGHKEDLKIIESLLASDSLDSIFNIFGSDSAEGKVLFSRKLLNLRCLINSESCSNFNNEFNVEKLNSPILVIAPQFL